MSVRAHLRDGGEFDVAARHGETAKEVVASLTSDALTGSAVPLADAEIELADGRKVPYANVSALVDTTSFR